MKKRRDLKQKPIHNFHNFQCCRTQLLEFVFIKTGQIYSRTHGPVEPLMILSCHILTNLDFLSPFSMLYLLNSLQWAVRWKTCQNMGAERSYREQRLLGCLVGETNLQWTEPSLGPRWQKSCYRDFPILPTDPEISSWRNGQGSLGGSSRLGSGSFVVLHHTGIKWDHNSIIYHICIQLLSQTSYVTILMASSHISHLER